MLRNGVRIVTEHLEHTRAVAIGFWLTTGSRFENSRFNGISHLMEHMLFKGTSRRTAYEIAVSLEALGGQLNAFTEKELTCFYAIVLDEHFETAVDVLSDIIQHPLLNGNDLAIEKVIINEEYRNFLDSPEDYIHERLSIELFKNHPLGLPILGSPASVHAIQKEDLVRYHADCYTGDRLIVSIAGNVDHSRCVEILEEQLAGLPLSGSRPDQNPLVSGTHTLPGINVVQTHICMGLPTFGYRDSDKFALLLLHNYLGNGMSSLLFQELREKHGWAYAVYSFTEFFSDTGFMGIYTGTDSQHSPAILELIQDVFKTLKQNGLSEADITRIKSQLTGGLILGMEDASHRMHRLAKMEFHLQSYVPIDHVLSKIESLKPEDLTRLIDRLNMVDTMCVVTLEPK